MRSRSLCQVTALLLGAVLSLASLRGEKDDSGPYEGEIQCTANADCPKGWICRPVHCPWGYWCFRRDEGERDAYNFGCVVDGFCDEEACESCFNCPEDCCVSCDVSAASTASAEYLSSSYELPFEPEDVTTSGIDVDGDNTYDYKFNLSAEFLINGLRIADFQESLTTWSASGLLLVGLRIHEGSDPADPDKVMVQVLPAVVHDATPTYAGGDVVRIDPAATTDQAVCGYVQEGRFVSNSPPVTLRFPVPHFGEGRFALLPLYHARVEARVDGGDWLEIHIGGGLAAEDIYTELYLPLVERMNQIIDDDPESRAAELIAGQLDGNCVQLYDPPQCQDVQWGVGECRSDQDPPVITYLELLCNALASSASSPDLDLDGDGADDHLSFSAFLRVVPAFLLD